MVSFFCLFVFQKLPVIQHLPCNAVHQTVFDCVKEINVPACLSGLDLSL